MHGASLARRKHESRIHRGGRARHDALFGEAFALIEQEILIHGGPRLGAPGFFAKRKLNKAVELFKAVLEINPESWQAMWGLGKIFQRLGEHTAELGWFRLGLPTGA